MDVSKISSYLSSVNQPKYRLGQILENYYCGKFLSFDDMTNISKDLRKELSNKFRYMSVCEDQMLSFKSSKKARLKLVDNLKIETVLLKYKDWNTVCVSTQVGCAMGCLFCATGAMGFSRNLTAEEIVDQIIYWRQKGFEIDRIVFMGMGEPFMNWQNVKKALEDIHENLNIGWRKMTVSTVGVTNGIENFSKWGKEVNLAISLHSLKQETREKIMPSAKKYRLEEIKKKSLDYVNKNKRLLFFEYTLMDGINDSNDDALRLSKLINSHKLYFLNLINLNRIEAGNIRPSKRVSEFCKRLDEMKVKYSLRRSMGGEIKGACGQLVTSN